MTTEIHPPAAQHLQCMEVWGGNQAVATAIAMPGLDTWVYSRPEGGADGGGDVHYASSCASGAISRLLLADVSGHGADAAEMARRLRRLMQRYINRHEQTRFVKAMSRAFAELSTGGRFATALAFTYDAPLNRLEFCNAGHPPPLVYRQTERCWSYLNPPRSADATNFPLGIDELGEYEQAIVAVKVGDIIFSYTDALPESRLRGAGGSLGTDRLGETGLLELVQRLDPSDPAQFVQTLLNELDAIAAIEDDLTILQFRFNGARPFVPLSDKLLAPFKVVRALARSYGTA